MTGDFDRDGDLDLAGASAVAGTFALMDNDYQLPVRLRPVPDTTFARDSGPHLLVPDIRAVFSDPSGSPWIEYSVRATTSNVRVALSDDHAVVIDFEAGFSGRENVFLTATNASGSTTDIVEVTVRTPAGAPAFSAALPDTIRLVVGQPHVLNLWEVVEDATTADPQLAFDFKFAPASVRVAFDDATGVLTLTASEVVGEASLQISATDTEGKVVRRTVALHIVQATDVESVTEEIPERHRLGTNAPNPFGATTTFEVGLSHDTELLLEVYSMLGRRVARLHHGFARAGRHAILFDAGRLPAGMYVCRMRTGDGFVQSRPVIVVR